MVLGLHRSLSPETKTQDRSAEPALTAPAVPPCSESTRPFVCESQTDGRFFVPASPLARSRITGRRRVGRGSRVQGKGNGARGIRQRLPKKTRVGLPIAASTIPSVVARGPSRPVPMRLIRFAAPLLAILLLRIFRITRKIVLSSHDKYTTQTADQIVRLGPFDPNAAAAIRSRNYGRLLG
ncbi:hypothetical protein V7x_21060 [Crateriforma conspicua]|uniref:Uncharacterized protein n=1 Tax=Crateriforma conspicua TaxID=2527996 RepID=A0A5C6FUE2_9PLAN|nr:hypothetical protein V7x_21060 [Crateriforma conspicua]